MARRRKKRNPRRDMGEDVALPTRMPTALVRELALPDLITGFRLDHERNPPSWLVREATYQVFRRLIFGGVSGARTITGPDIDQDPVARAIINIFGFHVTNLMRRQSTASPPDLGDILWYFSRVETIFGLITNIPAINAAAEKIPWHALPPGGGSTPHGLLTAMDTWHASSIEIPSYWGPLFERFSHHLFPPQLAALMTQLRHIFRTGPDDDTFKFFTENFGVVTDEASLLTNVYDVIVAALDTLEIECQDTHNWLANFFPDWRVGRLEGTIGIEDISPEKAVMWRNGPMAWSASFIDVVGNGLACDAVISYKNTEAAVLAPAADPLLVNHNPYETVDTFDGKLPAHLAAKIPIWRWGDTHAAQTNAYYWLQTLVNMGELIVVEDTTPVSQEDVPFLDLNDATLTAAEWKHLAYVNNYFSRWVPGISHLVTPNTRRTGCRTKDMEPARIYEDSMFEAMYELSVIYLSYELLVALGYVVDGGQLRPPRPQIVEVAERYAGQ